MTVILPPAGAILRNIQALKLSIRRNLSLPEYASEI